ncbi:hypothetical protein NL108_006012 [Boleophthalmus pectinirostris]|nr:hypothetical protein NL108_006012 [Boleophthalmus pectinirostris]
MILHSHLYFCIISRHTIPLSSICASATEMQIFRLQSEFISNVNTLNVFISISCSGSLVVPAQLRSETTRHNRREKLYSPQTFLFFLFLEFINKASFLFLRVWDFSTSSLFRR